MGAGSEAQNRTLADWLHGVDRGRLRLPSFQRGLAWDARRVQSMLQTIIHDLPLGVALILKVGDEQQFVSRPLVSAPETGETVTEHLLDGQQRLTALYRALRDNDDDKTFFMHFPTLDDEPRNDDEEVTIRFDKRWRDKHGSLFPRWVDQPRECLRRGLVPGRLLDPAEDRSTAWIRSATDHLEPGDDITDVATYREQATSLAALRARVEGLIAGRRETVKHFNLPYLALPATTSKHVALSVFVNMNTNSKPLRPHDIIVAELEGATGKRLQEMEAVLDVQLPRVKQFMSVDVAVLQTSALLQGKVPSERGYFDMDYEVFVENWSRMTNGLRRAIEALESLRIFDSERLPTAIPLPVIAALLADEPDEGDRRAFVDRIIRRYLWRSFFTGRYEAAAAGRAAADHTALTALLASSGSTYSAPVFDEDLFPLPSTRDLRGAGWPKRKGTLARAILAATNYFGARDFADDTALTPANVTRREYHHVFPNQLLIDAGIEPMLALNCALITWKTNRTIGRLDPLTYLEKRAEAAPSASDVKDRLESHLVPYDALVSAGPYEQPSGEALKAAVQPDFDRFLSERAELVHRFMVAACAGEQPHLRDVLDPNVDGAD